MNIPDGLRGWWRIVETSAWVDDDLDLLGPALISFTGAEDQLRMHYLVAQVQVTATWKDGLSFNWNGAWECEQVQGEGEVRLVNEGRIEVDFEIEDGDESAFVAVRAKAPVQTIL
ncbi:MAG: hypothetical protein ACE366_22035 [Bradymonadia bacterium]